MEDVFWNKEVERVYQLDKLQEEDNNDLVKKRNWSFKMLKEGLKKTYDWISKQGSNLVRDLQNLNFEF